MVKMTNKMIVLCSAALGSIYLTGFSLTDHPTQTASAATPLTKGTVTGHPVHHVPSPTVKVTSPPTTDSPSSKRVSGSGSAKTLSHTKSAPSKSVQPKSVQPKSVQPKSVQPKSVQPKSVQPAPTHKAVSKKVAEPSAPQNKVYKDGTFTGEASNRIGGVQVAVTTKADKIVAVKITNCTTSYSESNIAGLPQQVISKQSATIDLVSGATLMSEDFQGAVQQALHQAKL
jgi:uncharacterized protein with FMN-binding domain